jgi:predicted nucleotidyltransferase
LLDVIDVLNVLRVPYAVIGAFAASFYGVVRASLDADVLIALQPGQPDVNRLMDELRTRGLRCAYQQGDARDPVGAVLRVEDTFDNRVDLLMKIHGVTEAAFSRTIDAEFMNARVRVIGLEDLIAMKIFAGSPKDVHDVVGMLRVSSERVRLPLLKELVQRYGSEAVSKLESLLHAPPS